MESPLTPGPGGLRAFGRELKRWTVHCSVNALPSFIVAAFYIQLIQSPAALAAMFLALALFIFGYATLTTFGGDFAQRDSLIGRAVRAGAKIRLVMSLISVPFLLPGPWSFLVPDVWAGMAAVACVNWISNALGGSNAVINYEVGAAAPFTAVFATTVVEGLILSLLLFMFALFAMIALQRKDARRMLFGSTGPADRA